MTADSSVARSLLVVRREQTIKMACPTTARTRLSLSSVPAFDPTPGHSLAWILGAPGRAGNPQPLAAGPVCGQAGAVSGEGGWRSWSVTLPAALALSRHARLRVRADEWEPQSLPAVLARLLSHPARGLAPLAQSRTQNERP